VTIEHHALPDGYAERLEDLADRVALLVHNPDNPECFIREKREIQRQLWAMAEFPHPVSN